jgi:hypothetical protein
MSRRTFWFTSGSASKTHNDSRARGRRSALPVDREVVTDGAPGMAAA